MISEMGTQKPKEKKKKIENARQKFDDLLFYEFIFIGLYCIRLRVCT